MAVRKTRSKRVDLVGILEAAYRVEQSEEPWLAGVLDAATPALEDGLGVSAWTYDASDPENLRFRCAVARSDIPGMAELMRAGPARPPPELVTASFWTRRAARAREIPGWASFMGLPLRFDAEHVAHDTIGVNCPDPSGIGCMVGGFWGEHRRLDARERAAWDRVSTHVGAAFRLQRALKAKEQSSPTEAVLAPSGRMLHAEEPAQDRLVRDSLSEACQSIEHARTRKGRADGEISLSLWRSLVSERWTLVDTYERDGKRFVVARRNDVRMPLPSALSPRERQALGFAALGDSNKLIAYELGISASTVGVLLHRAAQKLGCHTRVELLQRFRELLAAAPPPGPPKPSTH
jgi:DNA-binding CsgD family transcriptional regulator